MRLAHHLAHSARASTSQRTRKSLRRCPSPRTAVLFVSKIPCRHFALSEMEEIKEQKTLEEEPHHHPSPLLSKRKSDADTATEDSDPSKKVKKSDVEIPIAAPQENHNSTVEEAQEDKGSNGNPRIDKGKAVMRDDKGKGKAKFEEEEEDSSRGNGGSSSDDDSDDGVENNGDDEDSDVSDDPLAEVDLDNILPSRTRRRAAEPGAYLVNDLDDDDDDEDDDVEEGAEDEDSE